MKTVSRVHDRAEQRASRLRGERLCQRRLLWLMADVSILRTVFTRLLPLCGNAVWWVAPVCLLPGIALLLACSLLLRVVHAHSLNEAAAKLLGRAGSILLAAAVAVPLLLDAAAVLASLVGFFTEGIGTEGTYTTIAALTCGAAALCLEREGLPRAVWFLRRPMQLAAIILAVNWLSCARTDALFPLLGEGESTVIAALRAGVSLGWPLILPLLFEPVRSERPGRLTLIVPVTSILAVMILSSMACIPAIAVSGFDAVDGLLLPLSGLHAWVRLTGQCLMMVALFFALTGGITTSSELLKAAVRLCRGRGLAYGLTAGLFAAQLIPAERLRAILAAAAPWQIVPPALTALVLTAEALIRGERRCG